MRPIKIIIVEDFHAETESVLREIEDADLNHVSEIVKSEKEFSDQLNTFSPDVILSPYSLSDTNAVKLLSLAREQDISAPFILLAFDLSEDIAIELLGAGMEDYVLRSSLKRLPVAIKKSLQRYKIQLELQLSEFKLRESESSLREAQEIAQVGSWEWEIGEEKVTCSDELFRIHGIERMDLTLADVFRFIHPRDKERVAKLYMGSHEDFLPVLEYTIIAANGVEKDVRAHSKLIKNGKDEVIRLVGTLQDVTFRKKIERELLRSESLLSLGEEMSNSGSFEIDLQSGKTIWSLNFYRITGISPGTVISRDLFTSSIHPDDRESYREVFSSSISSGICNPFIYRIVRPDTGQVVHLQASGKLIKGDDGETRWIGSVVDISDRIQKQIELEAKTLQRDLVLSTSKIGVWHWNMENDKLIWDERCGRLFENFSTDMDTIEFFEMVHPDDRKMVSQHLIEGLKTGEYASEYRIIRNGNTKYVLSRGHSTFGQDGKTVHMDGIIMDMTEKHLAEDHLQQGEQLFRDMAENISEVFWLTDWKLNKVLYISPRYESLYGSSVQELYEDSRSWSKNIHPDDLEFATAQFKKFASTGKYDIEYRLMMKDGTIKWVRDRSFPVLDADGNVARVAGITEEITDRKLAQEKIATLSLVASETSNGVLIQDAEGHIVWANQGFTEITGYTEKEVLGKEPWDILSGSLTDPMLVQETYQRMINGQTFTSENVLLKKTGEEVWVSTTFNPIMDETGTLKQIVSIGIDITRQKEAEFSRRTMLDELEKANQELRDNTR